MQKTVETSQLFKRRLELVEEKVKKMESYIIEKNFDAFCELTMTDSNQFHACCLDTFPPISYLVLFHLILE